MIFLIKVVGRLFLSVKKGLLKSIKSVRGSLSKLGSLSSGDLVVLLMGVMVITEVFAVVWFVVSGWSLLLGEGGVLRTPSWQMVLLFLAGSGVAWLKSWDGQDLKEAWSGSEKLFKLCFGVLWGLLFVMGHVVYLSAMSSCMVCWVTGLTVFIMSVVMAPLLYTGVLKKYWVVLALLIGVFIWSFMVGMMLWAGGMFWL